MRNLAILLLVSWVFPSLAFGATRHVPADFPTIQAAINAANNGDVVLVDPGTYAENITFLGKKITVTSSGGAAVTTIDPTAFASVVVFNSGEGSASVLSGFTISGGAGTALGGTDTFGGGIFCDGTSPTITGNVIKNNSAKGNLFTPGGSGGGIYCRNGSPSISGNTITGNQADDDGGGIVCVGTAAPEVTNNTISQNTALARGGGIAVIGSGVPKITGNTITSNVFPTFGGGISCGAAQITANIITDNGSLAEGGGIACGAATISDNQIARNTTGLLGGLGGGIRCAGAATITRNVISNNRAVGDGGGIGCSSGTAIITSNLIVDNHVDFAGSNARGGGVACSGASPVLTNDTFARNRAQDAGGAILASSSTLIANCILWDDTAPASAEIAGTPAVTFSDVEGGFGGAGNLDVDPLFTNAAGGDYHLLPTSPCVNVGSNAAPSLPAKDFEGDARIAYGTVDMGGDEVASCLVFFAKFGVGLAGSGGFVPLLDGTRGSCDAGGHVVHVSQGRGGAVGNLWIGLTQGDLPFFGGHFYVGFAGPWVTVPIHLGGAPGVPGAGFLDVPGSNVNAFQGLVLFMQVSLADPGAIHGVALTNGCKVTIGQ
jgi:parallel beta-helix repeat protein